MIGYTIEATSRKFHPINPEDLGEFLMLIGAELDEGPELRDDSVYVRINAYNRTALSVSKTHLSDLGFKISAEKEFEYET